MATKQKATPEDPRQEEEEVSGNGEGDEIMEEVEEQEEGYCEFFFRQLFTSSLSLSVTSAWWLSLFEPLTDGTLRFSLIYAYIYPNMDQLVLLLAWP